MRKLTLFLSLIIGVFTLQAQTIGVQLYSLRKNMETDLEASLSLLSSWGITAVEGSEFYGFNAEQYKTMLDKRDMKTIGITADFNVLATDPDSIIAMAKNLNAPYAICYWIPHEIGNFTVTDADSAISLFNKTGRQLADSGIKLCYHPHWYEFAAMNDTATFLDYIMANTSKSTLLLEFDVFWAQHAGIDPKLVLEKYADRIDIIHLKDRDPNKISDPKKMADPESNVVLGKGDVDIAGIIEQALQLEIEYLIVEDESSASTTQLPASIDYIKTNIDK